MKKIAYSLGAVATALSYQSFSAYIIFFYVDVMKLNASWAALGISFFGVWNALNDPVAGFISDRWRSRWGRRIPYVALGAIPFGLIYCLLWVPPFDASRMTWLFAYFVIIICLFDAVYTVVILNWASLFPEMYRSLKERAQVNSFRQTFGMLGLILGVALPPLIYGSRGWGTMGGVFGMLIAVIMLFTLFGSRESKKFVADKPLNLRRAIAYTLSSRSFMIFAASNLFVQYVFTIILAAVPFYAKYVLKVEAYGASLMLFSTFASAMIMMTVWRRLAVLLGAKKSYLAAIIVLAASLFPFLFINDITSGLISTVFVGAGLSGIILISDILISDVIDEDELRSGTRREGIFFGFNAFITRFAIGMEAATIGIVFVFTQYNAYIFHQSREFILWLRLLISIFPASALFIAFGLMMYYPLAGADLMDRSGR